MQQLPLNFARPSPRYGREDFIVSPCNEAALRVADAFANGGEPLLIVSGPAGAGKTHLLHLIASPSGCEVLGPDRALGPDREPGPGLILVDDIDRAGDPHALILLIERRRETGGRVAIAGRGDPRGWARGLRDLETRLAAAPRAVLDEPDEALLHAVILKEFADAGLRVPSGVADYAAPRLPRTFAAARAFVRCCEQEMREKAANITVPLAREVLRNLSEAVLTS